jgi:hypothetical protein
MKMTFVEIVIVSFRFIPVIVDESEPVPKVMGKESTVGFVDFEESG